MRGASMPSYHHLFALSAWLTFDFNQMFSGEAPTSAGSSMTRKVEYSEDTIRLAELLSSLPNDTQSLLLSLISNLPVV